MKKLQIVLTVAVMALVTFTSCNKKQEKTPLSSAVESLQAKLPIVNGEGEQSAKFVALNIENTDGKEILIADMERNPYFEHIFAVAPRMSEHGTEMIALSLFNNNVGKTYNEANPNELCDLLKEAKANLVIRLVDADGSNEEKKACIDFSDEALIQSVEQTLGQGMPQGHPQIGNQTENEIPNNEEPVNE